jgi:hypothetical protein
VGDDSKKGRPSKAGRRKGQFDKFFARTEEKKLRRVRKRNGAEAHTMLKDYFWELKFGRTVKRQIQFPKTPA